MATPRSSLTEILGVNPGASSLVAWHSADAGRRSDRRGPHRQSGTFGSNSIPTGRWRAGDRRLEPHGGAWLNSWLDRDLGISGRLSVRDHGGGREVPHIG